MPCCDKRSAFSTLTFSDTWTAHFLISDLSRHTSICTDDIAVSVNNAIRAPVSRCRECFQCLAHVCHPHNHTASYFTHPPPSSFTLRPCFLEIRCRLLRSVSDEVRWRDPSRVRHRYFVGYTETFPVREPEHRMKLSPNLWPLLQALTSCTMLSVLSVRRRRELMAKDAGATSSIYAPPTTEPEIRFQH